MNWRVPLLKSTMRKNKESRKKDLQQVSASENQPGGGRKGKLPSMRDKLLFLLYYLKVYPTFDVMGVQFRTSHLLCG